MSILQFTTLSLGEVGKEGPQRAAGINPQCGVSGSFSGEGDVQAEAGIAQMERARQSEQHVRRPGN